MNHRDRSTASRRPSGYFLSKVVLKVGCGEGTADLYAIDRPHVASRPVPFGVAKAHAHS